MVLLILFPSGGIGGPRVELAAGRGAGAPGQDPEAELVSFVWFVFDDAQATWTDLFAESGQTYQPAEMVLFQDAADSGRGFATSTSA